MRKCMNEKVRSFLCTRGGLRDGLKRGVEIVPHIILKIVYAGQLWGTCAAASPKDEGRRGMKRASLLAVAALLLGSEAMGDNAALTAAKRAKKDEFCTQRVDIENELRHCKAIAILTAAFVSRSRLVPKTDGKEPPETCYNT